MRLLSVAVLLLSVACSGMNPTSPSQVAGDGQVPHQIAQNQVAAADSNVDPYSLSVYKWDSSQYNATITITNNSDLELRYLLAVFDTHHAPSHADFLKHQELFSLLDISVPSHSSKEFTGKIKEGCDELFQADLFPRITVEDVTSKRVDIHPTATQVSQVTFKFGKSRSACVRPTIPEVPVPPTPTPTPVPPTPPTPVPVPVPPSPVPPVPPVPVPPIPPTPPVPPVPPPCEVVNPPTAYFVWPSQLQREISGYAILKNAGNWTVILHASRKMTDYYSNRSDYKKVVKNRVLLCGGLDSVEVRYPWAGHPSEYWWMEIKLNGVHFSKTAVEVNNQN